MKLSDQLHHHHHLRVDSLHFSLVSDSDLLYLFMFVVLVEILKTSSLNSCNGEERKHNSKITLNISEGNIK